MNTELNVEKLANMLRSKRGNKGLRSIAQEVGNITAPTLSRIERGNLPDVDTFFKLCKWLDVSPDFFTDKNVTKPTQQVITAHLRADKNLPPKTAEALIHMINLTYDTLSNSNIHKKSAKK